MSIINKVVDYFVSAKNELSKVTWPTRKETIRYSALVIAISVGVAVFFGVLDVGLSNLVTAALANKKVEQTIPTQVPVTPTVEGGQPAGAVTEVKTQDPTINFDQVTPITTPTDTKK
ncbi:MAG: preprotein translocase subunit SecE [Patescibacteria group bacterium]|nr:preprotein translocase subunit SecE [Patescibacteria group bacterium]